MSNEIKWNGVEVGTDWFIEIGKTGEVIAHFESPFEAKKAADDRIRNDSSIHGCGVVVQKMSYNSRNGEWVSYMQGRTWFDNDEPYWQDEEGAILFEDGYFDGWQRII